MERAKANGDTGRPDGKAGFRTWMAFAVGLVAGLSLFAIWGRSSGSPRRLTPEMPVQAASQPAESRLGEVEAALERCYRDRETLVQGVSGCIDDGQATEQKLRRQLALAQSIFEGFLETAGAGAAAPLDNLARGLVSLIIVHGRNERVSRCTGYLVRRGDDVRLYTAGHCVAELKGEGWVHLVRYRYDPLNALLVPEQAPALVVFEHTVCRRDGLENPAGRLGGREGVLDLAGYELVRGGLPSRCLEISATRESGTGAPRISPEAAAHRLLEDARPGAVRSPAEFDQVHFAVHMCRRPPQAQGECMSATDAWVYVPVVGTVIGRSGAQDAIPFFVLNQRVRPGDSGGPVISLDGSLVGLVSATHLGKSLSLFTPVAAVWD